MTDEELAGWLLDFADRIRTRSDDDDLNAIADELERFATENPDA